MKILAVIPARGGSKGIPQKNIRLLSKKPLISYSIANAAACPEITDIVVSTDNDEIAYVAGNCGAQVLMRSNELSNDDVTLDPVVYDAVLRIEEKKGYAYDFVITMQPTSPLLKPRSLRDAIHMAKNDKYDCVISVVDKPHLSWKKNKDRIIPNYEKRLNRQLLPPCYLETGAFVISRRNLLTAETRMAGRAGVYVLSDEESIDIDDRNEWILCEALLNRKRIIFRMDGCAALGMGHVYNCITLAYAMMEHNVLLVISKDSIEGIRKVKETNLPYRVIENENEINEVIQEFQPDIWVNDRLNTEASYIRKLKALIPRVVTIEDLGTGTAYADAVINALYTDSDLQGRNVFNGWKYACLRDEFQTELPKPFSDKVKNIMVMFGNADPDNYNKILYEIILRIASKYTDVRFNFVIGTGYDYERNGLYTVEDKNVYVHQNVQRVTKFMREADLAVISQGKTVFEFAAMGIPAVVLSQNRQEKPYNFASIRHGFINLGIDKEAGPDVIENTLDWLISTNTVRENMYDLMLKYPLREGLDRVKGIILGSIMNDTA